MTHQEIEAVRKNEEALAGESPSPYLRAMLMRLRIEMLSAAKALHAGALRTEFWKIVDDLIELRLEQQRAEHQRAERASALAATAR